MKFNKKFSLNEFYEVDTLRYYSHGRHALVAGLKALNIKKGDKVALPEFICHDLLASIHAVDAFVIYYSLGENLLPDFSKISNETLKALIVVNYFGFPQDINLYKDITDKTGAILIEDNAHGFLSRDEQGMLLGKRAAMGILSLRKTFNFPDGAVLLLNESIDKEQIERPLDCVNNSLSKGYKVKRILGNIQLHTGIRLRSYSESLTRFIRKARTGHKLPVSSPESETVLPGQKEIHCESMRMLQLINPDDEVKKRRSLYDYFHKNLSHLDIEPLFSSLPTGTVPFGYPFHADELEADKVVKIAHKKGFSCAPWPDLPVELELSAPNFHKNVWWVNFLC